MCGRLNVIDDPWVQQLCFNLGINLSNSPLQNKRFVSAANPVQIITESQTGERQLKYATWWLLLEQTETGFKPSKYTSFNTRYDKLNVPRSAGYKPFRTSRCIVPVKGWGETRGSKSDKEYFDFAGVDSAIALGGLYKEYRHPVTGELVTACSVITLPPHAKTEQYHPKSSPLILPQDNTLDYWLAPSFQQVQDFEHLLTAQIPQDITVTPINKPSEHQAIGNSLVIGKD